MNFHISWLTGQNLQPWQGLKKFSHIYCTEVEIEARNQEKKLVAFSIWRWCLSEV